MSKYSDERMIKMAHDVLDKLSKDESIDFAKYLLMKNWPENDILIREKIFRFLRENNVATKRGLNWKYVLITDFGKLVSNEIGGLKQYIYNKKNPISVDKNLKLDLINYLINNEHANKSSNTNTYSKFRNIENERVESCADYLIKKNIIKLVENSVLVGLTLKPREPAYRIKENPQDFDLIVKTAKYSQDSSDDLSRNEIPAKKSEMQKETIEKISDKPSGKVQKQLRNIAVISVIITGIGLLLAIIKSC